MKHSLATSAAAAPFAHLLGLGRKSAARRAEDDKPEDDKDAVRAEGEDDEDEKDDKDAVRAEGEDDDSEDGDDKKTGKGKRGKKARADDDETCAEEDDEDEDVSGAAKAGRRAERVRCRKIFSTTAAGLRPDVAAQLAFTTNLSSAEAIGILESAASGAAPQAGRRIDERMSRVIVPPLGSGAPAPVSGSGPKGMAAQIVAAAKKRRGEQ